AGVLRLQFAAPATHQSRLRPRQLFPFRAEHYTRALICGVRWAYDPLVASLSSSTLTSSASVSAAASSSVLTSGCSSLASTGVASVAFTGFGFWAMPYVAATSPAGIGFELRSTQ